MKAAGPQVNRKIMLEKKGKKNIELIHNGSENPINLALTKDTATHLMHEDKGFKKTPEVMFHFVCFTFITMPSRIPSVPKLPQNC